MTDVVKHFDRRFRAIGTAARAADMKAYMKSALRFHGVDAKQLRGEVRAYLDERELTRAELVAQTAALFATAAFDLRSAAIVMLEREVELLAVSDLPWLAELARTAACWAHVDALATHVIGPTIATDPLRPRRIRAWAIDPDFWIRRVALLAELGTLRRGAGDFALFAEIAAPMLPETEFFIRKAIGWVLREVSKRRPELVAGFLREHAAACSGLTWREATRALPAATRASLDKLRAPRPAAAARSKARKRRAG